MSSAQLINIILVDDHPMFLNGLQAILSDESQIRIVGQAINGEEALELLTSNEIDVVVTDISMPGMDGIKLTTAIKSKFPKVKVLVLSTYNDPERIEKLIKKDVDGYLLKNAEKEELIRALKEISEGQKYFSIEVKESYMNSFFSPKPAESEVKLSRREKEILTYLAKEYTAKEIGEALFISAHTVNTHKKNLMSKLQVKNSAGLVKYALQSGLGK